MDVGDFLVAYLSRKRSPNGFFAIGKVIAPRKKPNHGSTVEAYVSSKQSHGFSKGVIHYSDAPAFYEDFDDKWRPNDDSLSRYAQELMSNAGIFVCETGVPWLSEIAVGPNQQQRALFQIKKSWFDKIVKVTSTIVANQGTHEK